MIPARRTSGALRLIRKLLILFMWAWLACLPSPEAERRYQEQLEGILRDSWAFYKKHFILEDGRVIRPENHGDTISEGQAYALLRAVWSGDQPTFDRVYHWTINHLSKERLNGTYLLAWHFGQDQEGNWRLLDHNSASDADLDYALALVLAARRWSKPSQPLPDYLPRVRAVLRDILERETCRDPTGRLWLTPGDWIECRLPLLLNPSYFSPAWYQLFAELTGDNRWRELQATSHQGLTQLSARLGNLAGVGLPSDWARLTAPDRFDPDPQQSAIFGWDAVRSPWRQGLAVLWWGQPEARRWLQENFLPFSRRQLTAFGRLAAIYDYRGQPAAAYESPVLYASLVAAALAVGEPELARQAVDKIRQFYHSSPDGGYFNRPDDYYGNNWAWFGLATYRGWVKP